MPTTRPLAAFTLAVLLATPLWTAHAQTATPTAPGEGARRSTSLAPAGEGPGNEDRAQRGARTSTTTRAARKSETRAAQTMGTLQPAGEAAEAKDDEKARETPSTRSRAARKAQTRADVKARNTQPAGEAAQPYTEPPKK